eukprot:74647-Prymnesium_polylepis.1
MAHGGPFRLFLCFLVGGRGSPPLKYLRKELRGHTSKQAPTNLIASIKKWVVGLGCGAEIAEIY